MTFLPIVARELRVTARRRGTYWVRMGAALAALAIGSWIMLLPGLRSPQLIGQALFVGLSVIAFVYSLFAGLLTTSDCLSEEKREGTLGLLFLTDLKGYDVVLGKLAATSLNAFYGMLAIFPVMAIPLLAGGVTGSEFWRVVLVSVNNLLLSLAIGMFCSAISKDERKAAVLAFVLAFSLTVLVPLFGSFLSHWNRPPALFYLPSPGFSCVMAFEANYRSVATAGLNEFYISALCIHGMTWLFLVGAALIVPRTWQDRAESAAGARLRDRWLRWAHGSAGTRRLLRQRLLEINPFYWLAGRDRTKVLLVWGFLAGGALVWSWGLWRSPTDWRDSGAYVWTALIAHTAFKFWIASEACRRFSADRKSGALELLLATPLEVREILRGQLLALIRQFAAPTAVVLLADLIFMMAERNDREWVSIWVALMVVFVADLITLSWVGMWTGLSSRHRNRAAGAALVRVLIVPWIVFAIFMTLMALSSGSGRSRAGTMSEGQLFVLTGVFIALINNLVFGFSARQRLLHDFRSAATQRFDARQFRIKAERV